MAGSPLTPHVPGLTRCPCRQPTTQLRWVEPDGRMMVRLEGQPAGKAEGGGMRAAVAEAAGRLSKGGRWFQALLELAAHG